MKIAALLTGRGNNTLKDKNVLPVLGKPLLYYPAMAAKTCNLITDFYVSSDDEKILKQHQTVVIKNCSSGGTGSANISTCRCNKACFRSDETGWGRT